MKLHTSLMIVGVLFFISIVGCTTTLEQTPQPSGSTPVVVTECATKECFISSANECNELTVTLTEDAGVLKYTSATDCTFTKTLVSVNANESQEMKTLLEGKSLTCKYEKGKFDQKVVNSLMFGIDACQGELKDNLIQLTTFL